MRRLACRTFKQSCRSSMRGMRDPQAWPLIQFYLLPQHCRCISHNL